MKGQYLERPTIVPAANPSGDDAFLEGLFHRGERAPAALIVAPLADGGSPMEIPIVAELAWAMHQSKRATLRYNPGGFGASSGTAGEATLLSDATAALLSLRESLDLDAPIAAVGIQSGARIALELSCADARLAALVLLDPPSALAESVARGVGAPSLILLSEGSSWPGKRGASGAHRVEELPGTDAQFLQGLPFFGKAITDYLNALAG